MEVCTKHRQSNIDDYLNKIMACHLNLSIMLVLNGKYLIPGIDSGNTVMAERQFDEIERGGKSDIRGSAINEKSVNLPLAKYLLAHIRPQIVQRLQPPQHNILQYCSVKGEENWSLLQFLDLRRCF